MTRSTTPIVLRQIVVPASVQRAFAVFTQRFGDIKPRDHNLMTAPITDTVLEPRVGGRIYDRAADGGECTWGHVLAFEPPHRLLFSWDIGPNWQVEPDPANRSEVEVRFVAEADDRTRVELEHRNLDRHGPGWEGIRDAVDGDNGWPLYLHRFVTALG
ncbi:ATPase [Actinoplanes sp. SE50]|uniref:SRPBCC family protein n=1 Tax=unclassified Actinoplanes TaxID=2626549 RepID=UPI00023EC9D2|nr:MULTISPECIES: SRPBCC family protein [unclassified Actinoplanes]AEV85969.1 hypothetical protein ACPL_5082 [Actinoplanes sp. SE50/110]ATO84367.1 ATPase [Actinoplanes sp. SE50]SLM01777.1 ATPase [Actinoplanes sp. SE50/110]